MALNFIGLERTHKPEPGESKVLLICDAETFKPLRLATKAEDHKPMIFRSKGRLVRAMLGYASELD